MKTNRLIVGVDVAKHVFQLYWVDVETGEEMNLRLARAKFLRHFANHVSCLVALEACGGSLRDQWARVAKLDEEIAVIERRQVPAPSSPRGSRHMVAVRPAGG